MSNSVKSLRDCRESLSHSWLKFGIGKDIGPIILDPLAHQFADIEGVDSGCDGGGSQFGKFANRPVFGETFNASFEPRRHIARRLHDFGADPSGT